MEELLLRFCSAIAINTAACNNALLGLYTNSNVQKEFNASKSFSEGRVNYYINENKTVVYTTTALYSGYDMYRKKEIRLSTPLRPLCDSLSLDLKADNNNSINMNWDWKF